MLVLIIDDNPVDIDLLRMGIDLEHGWNPDIVVAEDGEAAVAMLEQFVRGHRKPAPDFIVLDFNLPRRDGAEVLNVIRSTAALADIPVAVLSSSPRDVIRHKLTGVGVGADGYFTKPLDLDEFLGIGKKLRDWFGEQSTARVMG